MLLAAKILFYRLEPAVVNLMLCLQIASAVDVHRQRMHLIQALKM